MPQVPNRIRILQFLWHDIADMKRKSAATLPVLKKGQLWKTKTARIEIMEMGKLLAHYRFFTEGRVRVSTTLARVSMIQDYLVANHAVLIKNDRLKEAA